MISGVDFWKSIEEEADDAAIEMRPTKAYIGDDDGQRVTLRFPGEDQAGQQRYPRIAGPGLEPGTPVYALRVGRSRRDLLVLGAISSGEWDALGVEDTDTIDLSLSNNILRADVSSVPWGSVSGKPGSFPPEPHNHDERYYTQGEVDTAIEMYENSYITAGLTNTTNVGASYGSAEELYRTTLNTLLPWITEGTWDISVIASVIVYRSVASGGVYIFVGSNAGSAFGLGRGFPQDAGYQMSAYLARRGVPYNEPIVLKYQGWNTAGVTHTTTHGVMVTARRSS